MPCSHNIAMTLQTGILSVENLDFFKQIISFKLSKSVLYGMSKVVLKQWRYNIS